MRLQRQVSKAACARRQQLFRGQSVNHGPMVNRALKRQSKGGELQVTTILFTVPVEPVTRNSKAGVCQMPANLMFATGLYFHLHERTLCIAVQTQEPHLAKCSFAVDR